MRRFLAAFFTLTLLSGCAEIPYEQPQDRSNIERDLALTPQSIVTLTKAAWCVHPYGDMTPCTMQQALAVQTRTALILASYDNKHYTPLLTTQASEVMCAHAQASVDTAPNFYLFTKEHALQLWPLDPKNTPDLAKKKLMLGVMAQGKDTFVGPQGNFVEDSGRLNYGGGFIANTTIAYSTSTKIMQLVNPCVKAQ